MFNILKTIETNENPDEIYDMIKNIDDNNENKFKFNKNM